MNRQENRISVWQIMGPTMRDMYAEHRIAGAEVSEYIFRWNTEHTYNPYNGEDEWIFKLHPNRIMSRNPEFV